MEWPNAFFEFSFICLAVNDLKASLAVIVSTNIKL